MKYFLFIHQNHLLMQEIADNLQRLHPNQRMLSSHMGTNIQKWIHIEKFTF